MEAIKTEVLTEKIIVFPRELEAFEKACNKLGNVITYKYPHDLYFLGQNFLHFKRKHNIY